MNRSTNELKKKILQKNLTLAALTRDSIRNEDGILQLMTELDLLLYQYYKQLRCK